MKATLSTRLIVWVGVPATLLFASVIWSASGRSLDRVAAQTEMLSRSMARRDAAELESKLSEARKISQMIGLHLESGALTLEIVLKDVAALPVEKITRGVVRDVRTFCGERELSDDISVMAVRWHGSPATPPLP